MEIQRDLNSEENNPKPQMTDKRTGADTTTGSGYSEAERNHQDATSSDSEEAAERSALIDSYNINDQAHRQSDKQNFHQTISNFHHKDEAGEGDSRH